MSVDSCEVACSDGLEEFDLFPGRDRHDGLLPAGNRAHRSAPAPLLLGADTDDPHVENLDLELGLDRGLDEELVRVACHGERVVVALGLERALLADHWTQEHVVQAAGHAYTSVARSRASWVKTTVSASSRSTTFRLSARITRTSCRLRQERSTASSRDGRTRRTLPSAFQLLSRASMAFVRPSSSSR